MDREREEINAPNDIKPKAGQIWRNKKSGVEYEIEGAEIIQPALGIKLGFYILKNLVSSDVEKEGVGVFERRFEFVGSQSEPSREDKKGIKADSNKRRYSLLPTGTINVVVDVLEAGSKKYSDNNWQKVPDARTRYYDAALRHIDAWFSGELLDDETGKSHLAHAVCCLLFLMWFDLKAGEV